MNAKRPAKRKTLATLAKANRKRPTKAETMMWRILRGRRLAGYKFRRQHPLGDYITDFACLEEKVIVELDGGQHADPRHEIADRLRTDFLRRYGFTVLRFWNAEAVHNPEGVAMAIASFLHNGKKP